MTKDELEALLTGDNVKLKVDLDSHERDQLTATITSPGFFLLLGILLGHREGVLRLLQNQRVPDQAGAQQLGVLQGQALAVDIVRRNIIDCLAVPTDKED